MIGQRFGRLVVEASHRAQPHGRWQSVVRCDCGTVKTVEESNVRSGRTESCGCLRLERVHAASATHGMSKTPEYKIWVGMITRCENTAVKCYSRYGGRGITVSPEWRASFAQFMADMGPRPDRKYSIDRLDNDKGYSAENCAWRTASEQANNRRCNTSITYNGKTMTVRQWSRHLGGDINTVYKRLRAGWSPELAVSAPRARTS